MPKIRESDAQHPISQLLRLFAALPVTPADASPQVIHRIRVAIKRTRAWLKLCRAMTGDTPAYRQLVEGMRRLSHDLAGQRDCDVALETLAALARKYPGQKAEHVISVLRQHIAQAREPVPDLATFHLLIEQLQRELPLYSDVALTRETQVDVIDHTWAKMCKAGKHALDSEACADLHAWRKRVKTLTYQLEMAGHSLPRQHKQYLRLNKLGKRLGKVHDLCFLQSMVEEIAASAQPPLKPMPVFKRIRRERRRQIESSRKHYRRLCPQDKPAPADMGSG